MLGRLARQHGHWCGGRERDPGRNVRRASDRWVGAGPRRGSRRNVRRASDRWDRSEEGIQGGTSGGHQIGGGRSLWVSEPSRGFKVFFEMTGPTIAMEVLGQGTDKIFITEKRMTLV